MEFRRGFLATGAARATPTRRVEFVSSLVTLVSLGDGRGEVRVTPLETPLPEKERAAQLTSRWPVMLQALRPGDWREFTVFPGALDEAQLQQLRQQQPATKLTLAWVLVAPRRAHENHRDARHHRRRVPRSPLA